MSFNDLRDEVFKIACDHGFHDIQLSDEHCLMLVITELSEAVEADRKSKNADIAKFNEWQGNLLSFSESTRIARFNEDFEAYIKNSVADELADTVIRLLDLAGMRNIDLNDRFVISYIVSKKKSFTENCYAIIKDIVNYKYTIEECINYAIRQLIELAGFYNINLERHIKMKMKYNSLRENKHGKKY